MYFLDGGIKYALCTYRKSRDARIDATISRVLELGRVLRSPYPTLAFL